MIPDHSHCEICGRTVPVGATLCDDPACQEKKDEAQAQKKRSVYLLVALITAAVLLSKLL